MGVGRETYVGIDNDRFKPVLSTAWRPDILQPLDGFRVVHFGMSLVTALHRPISKGQTLWLLVNNGCSRSAIVAISHDRPMSGPMTNPCQRP